MAFRADAGGFVRFLKRIDELRVRDHHDRIVTSDSVVDHDTACSVYFSDPDGHRLEVTASAE